MSPFINPSFSKMESVWIWLTISPCGLPCLKWLALPEIGADAHLGHQLVEIVYGALQLFPGDGNNFLFYICTFFTGLFRRYAS
jgi:hypothetical protein